MSIPADLPQSWEPLRPYDLRTERERNPLGLDERIPLFGWKLAGSGRDRSQRGYRIRVVSEGDPRVDSSNAVWDSGVVESNDSVDVPYAGDALTSRTRYSWSVLVTDESAADSDWAEPARFETALFDADDWQGAEWIVSPTEPGAEAARNLDWVGGRHVERIWLPAGDFLEAADSLVEQVFFRGQVKLEQKPTRARLLADADAELHAFVNGTEVPADGSADDRVTAALLEGDNVVAIAVTPGDTPAALAASLDITFADGTKAGLVTDGTWLASATDSKNEADWKLAESFGHHGTAPHGRSPLTYRPSPYLRKEFGLATGVRSARLYVTALGVYEARINGHRVGNDQLTPSWTDYATRLPYQTYDVTELLHEGGNVVGAVLADGWYAGNVCWFGTFQYGDKRALLARLEIEHEDGGRTVVATDGSWHVGEGETRYADLQNGEVVDARAEPQGWDEPGFDAGAWAQARVDTPSHGPLGAQIAPPIRVEHELPAEAMHVREDGRILVDFGQNLVGWVRLDLRGEAGHRVMLRHAEALDHNGELYIEALRGARATDEYVLRGDAGGETFEPRFTVHGFRFCEIVNHPGELRLQDITARVAHAAMEPIGEHSNSHEHLTKLQQNIVWGQRGNFLAVPTDCPQRDERLGWTGDAQVFASTAAFNYDVRGFLRKWMYDLRDSQYEDGAVPHVAPDVLTRDGRANEAGAAGWADAVAIVPLELYRAYGDRRVVEESLEAVDKWLGFLEENSDGFIRPNAGFADWLAFTQTPRDLVATAFFAYAARCGAELAREIGRTVEAQRFETQYANVRAAFRARYVRGGGKVVSGTQTAYVLALHFDLLDEHEQGRAVQALVDNIAARNWHLSTGFLGTPYLLQVLTRFGREDIAYRLLLQDTMPSWLYPVVHGEATTMWERWDSWSDSHGFQDPGMTSFNHYAYGAVGEWIYRELGGLAPGAPGYRHVVIRPRLTASISWSKTSLETPYGPVSVNWSTTGGEFALQVSLPANTTGEVWLPGQEPVRIGSGEYTFG